MAAPRFLFVHGSWHGAWCFDLLRLELQRRAVKCAALDLPALGDDETEPAAATFEAGVERILEAMGSRRWVLVGHSFGAFYTTEAAMRAAGQVRDLVYLASYVPVLGDTYASIQEVCPLDEEVRQRIEVDEAQGTSVLPPEAARDCLFHDVAEGIAGAAAGRLKPQPLEPFRSAAVNGTEEAFKALRRRAVFAEEDRMLPIDRCVAMAERAGISIDTVPTGHCPFLSMPKLLADQLLGVS